jgi:hypothetical protein
MLLRVFGKKGERGFGVHAAGQSRWPGDEFECGEKEARWLLAAHNPRVEKLERQAASTKRAAAAE